MSRKKVDQFDLDEIYRDLRTNIEFSQVDKKVQVLNILSTFPDEGKSTVSQNLARILAAKYKKVLLIDCDLRSPSIHRRFHVSNQIGLTNILNVFDPESKSSVTNYPGIQKIQGRNGETFSFISAGHRVPNPSEMIGSKRFAAFIEACCKEYEYIVLDCPPISVTSDAIPLSSVADGTLYVVSAKDTDKRKAKAAINDLQRNGIKILGIILNKTDSENAKGYDYNYKYRYYYSDSDGNYKYKKYKKTKYSKE